jgi:peptidoglycan hydrolase-like protein with peptidoglycan-binding domain
MLNRKVRTLAVAGIMVVAATLVALSTTAASAATTPASAPRVAQVAADPSGCVTETFTTADEPYYEACVADAQILFNDLWHTEQTEGVNLGVGQLLTVDGSYGPDTANVVGSFQVRWALAYDHELGPQTWGQLCSVDQAWGYTGTYWHDAGCATE